MKKLISISVIFALVVGAAFAEATLGGQLMIGANLLQGDSGEDSEVTMGGLGFHEAKIHATFGDSKGGGKIVMVGSNPSNGPYQVNGGRGKDGQLWTWGFLWWRPVAQFRMQVGSNADGDYGAAAISGWTFTGEGKNSVGAVSDYSDWGSEFALMYPWQSGARPGSAFYPGTGDFFNANFSFFPADGVRISLILPFGTGKGFADDGSGDGGSQILQDQLADTQLNAAIDVGDAGKLNLAFVGMGGLGKDMENAASAANIYASFYLTALDSLKLELGLVYNTPFETAAGKANGGYLGTGLGLLFNADAFSVKFRVNARFGGKERDEDMNTTIYANVLPSYKINSSLTFFLYAGLNTIMNYVAGTTTIGWFVNPYIAVNASDGLRFWSGVQIWQTEIVEGNEPLVNWRVPFGFNFYF